MFQGWNISPLKQGTLEHITVLSGHSEPKASPLWARTAASASVESGGEEIRGLTSTCAAPTHLFSSHYTELNQMIEAKVCNLSSHKLAFSVEEHRCRRGVQNSPGCASIYVLLVKYIYGLWDLVSTIPTLKENSSIAGFPQRNGWLKILTWAHVNREMSEPTMLLLHQSWSLGKIMLILTMPVLTHGKS